MMGWKAYTKNIARGSVMIDMDWLLMGCLYFGTGLAMYVLGYYDGRYRGYWAGRKDGSRSTSRLWLSALTNRPELLTELSAEDDDGK